MRTGKIGDTGCNGIGSAPTNFAVKDRMATHLFILGCLCDIYCKAQASPSLGLGRVSCACKASNTGRCGQIKLCMLEIRVLVPGEMKPMTYEIDTCRFLAWRLPLIGKGKGWFAQCEDNVPEWDIGSLARWPNFPVGAAQ